MTCSCTPELPATSPRLLLCSPFLMGNELDSVADIQDALTHAIASITLWSDLFTAKAAHHQCLDSDQARHGMHLQLTALGHTLSAISNALGTLQNTPPRND